MTEVPKNQLGNEETQVIRASANGGHVVVVGIGADGWDGLGAAAHEELMDATVIAGSQRQLALLPDSVTARQHPWTSPMIDDLDQLLAQRHSRLHILASGDPLMHGVGSSVIARVGVENTTIIPAVSSVSLAAARMGWDLQRVRVVSIVNQSPESVVTVASDGVSIVVLARDASSPRAVAHVLTANGFGDSTMTVLEDLGGSAERHVRAQARAWNEPPGNPLAVIAVSCSGPARTRLPGRDDAEYDTDGQLTKSSIRALTLSALAPAPGQLLWDIGGGSGSVSIEWLIAERDSHAIIFEADQVRAERIAANLTRHGVADRATITGSAPNSFADALRPDTVFIGGGLTVDGVLQGAWESLRENGLLVANTVTLESEAHVTAAYHRLGGDLRRIQIDHATPLAAMTTWRPILPVTQWRVFKLGRSFL